MDIFDEKNIKPMLINPREQAPFNSEEYIYEIKFDGVRAVMYIDKNEITLRNKRNKHLNEIYPELTSVRLKNKCILCGEIIVMKDGKPSFSEVQKRSLMTNKFKIEMAAKKLPVSFIAYDILYIDGEQITDKPLMERLKILDKVIEKENHLLSKSRYIEEKGIELYQLTKEQGLEGIVAKKKNSLYYFNKRTKDWIKIKNMLEEDFIVCGFEDNDNKVSSIVLGIYERNKIKYIGHVTLGVSREDYRIIAGTPEVDKDKYYENFPERAGSVWIEPDVVCTVKFMDWTVHGGLRQPIFKGVRDDKEAKECTLVKKEG